jgi:DNA repair exonuclease SbcCD ATPase subunit
MHITRLVAENIKKLKLVDITPDGNLVQITGANGQGKTSVLDAIFFALGGGKAIQGEPVRRGAKAGMVKLDLGDLIVTRRFNAEGATALQVEAPSGAIYKSPQSVLDALLGKLAFDPLAFTRLAPKDQLAQLREIVTVDIDLDALDGANQRDFAARTEIHREAKSLRAQADAIVVPEGLPAEPVDVAGLLSQIEAAASTNSEIEKRQVRREQTAGLVKTRRMASQEKLDEAARLRARAAELEAEGHAANLAADADQKRLDEAEALPEPVDTAELRRLYDEGQAINRQIEQAQRQAELAKQADAKDAEAKRLTDAMDQRTRERAAAIARAAMPVPGLGFGDGMVTLNDLPFDQASGAEQLRASIAVAMAMNPKLRVLLIKDGSLLDKNGIKLVAELAAANDMQVWMESVDTSGTVGIVMEDGNVVATNPAVTA